MKMKAADIGMCYRSAIEVQPWHKAPHTQASNLGPRPPRKKGKMSVAIVAHDDHSYSWSKNILYDGRKVFYL